MYISTARPVIYLEYANLQVFGYTPSGDGLNGFVSFGGVVLSGLADTTPDGVISSIRVWIDGHPENTLEFPLNVYKDNTGDLGAPYPYMGNFYVDSLPVQNLMPDGDFGSGWAIFHIETEDCLGSGVAEVEFYVDLTPINSDIFPQQLQAQSPAFILNDDDDDTVPLAVEIEGPQDVISSAGFEVQTLDGTRPVVQWPDENGDPHYYLATADGSRPEVMLAIEDPDGDKACWLDTGDPSCDDSSGGGGDDSALAAVAKPGTSPQRVTAANRTQSAQHSAATAVKPCGASRRLEVGPRAERSSPVVSSTAVVVRQRPVHHLGWVDATPAPWCRGTRPHSPSGQLPTALPRFSPVTVYSWIRPASSTGEVFLSS